MGCPPKPLLWLIACRYVTTFEGSSRPWRGGGEMKSVMGETVKDPEGTKANKCHG